MTERTAKLFGILGATLFLSFAVMFLLFGKEHWHVLALSIPCVYFSWKFSAKYGSHTYFLMDLKQNLQLPLRSICEPARKGDCIVFLLEDKSFYIWNQGVIYTGQSMQKFEPLTPLIISKGFVAWMRGFMVWFDFEGSLRGQFPIAGQGVSLLQNINDSVLVGTTDNSLFLWEAPDVSPISLQIQGIPLIIDHVESCLLTSNGCFYDLSNVREPSFLAKIDREILEGFRFCGLFVYFDDRSQIFYRSTIGEECFIDFFQRDLFYPQKVGDRIIYVNREYQCCALVVEDGEFVSKVLVGLTDKVTWLRWFDSYLLAIEEESGVTNLIKIGPMEEVNKSQVLGEFNPLGIDEMNEVFHYSVEQEWFKWNLVEKSPSKVDEEPPQQILFFKEHAFKLKNNKWYAMNDEAVETLSAAMHDHNFSLQKAGLIEY